MVTQFKHITVKIITLAIGGHMVRKMVEAYENSLAGTAGQNQQY
jgi:hypothetical protein